ncbi:MAG: MBOAT family protein [Agathobacter sp.]|nr:MBOAT family protein [Agathobacter sp.]
MKSRPYWLLVTSLFFYACFDFRYFLFWGFCVISTYFSAKYMEDTRVSQKNKKVILVFTIVVNIGLLIFVKFYGYAMSIVESIFHVEIDKISVIVPLGIAFYTLQAISYCVDVYKGQYTSEKSIFKYALYMSYFPIIMQGPISRYHQLSVSLYEPHKFSFDRMKSGLSLALWGFFKKMVIADRAAMLVNQVFGSYVDYRGLEIVLAVFLYTIQLYTDFSGCVDISRGVSEVLGIQLTDNFKHPYFATSIKDFWRRWHISLSSWFRDYIYIPLGGNRKGKVRRYINLLVVFLVSGLWHGVGFNYIAWGFMHGGYQVIGELTQKKRNQIWGKLGVKEENVVYKFWKKCYTFALVAYAWLFFRASGFKAAIKMTILAFSTFNPEIFWNGRVFQLGLDKKDALVLASSCIVLLIVSILQEKTSVRKLVEKQNVIVRWTIYVVAICCILIFGIYGPGFDESQFLYMQF